MQLPILQVGNPVLRAVAQPLAVADIKSQKIQDMIEDMRETMLKAPGVGLAAPQIGESIQLVVIQDDADAGTKLSPSELANRMRQPVPFHVLINPILRFDGGEMLDFFEGCLSLNGFTANTKRFKSVSVTALDHHGVEFTRQATGWYARILQHEVDHLNGMLYIDRMHTRSFATVENKTQFGEILY